MNYKEAKELMKTARNKAKGKPLENNTRLHETEGGNYEVRLHGYAIVTIMPTCCRIDSCGWKTVTTKDRLNKYAWGGTSDNYNICVVQKKGTWYVKTWSPYSAEHTLTEFYDGMEFANLHAKKELVE